MTFTVEQERVEFFDILSRTYRQAETELGQVRWDGALGGQTISLLSAGAEPLERLVPALRPWKVKQIDASPSLTVSLWDGGGEGRYLPLLVRALFSAVNHSIYEALDARHELRGFNDDRIFTVYRQGPCKILSVLDRQRAQALYWVEDAKKIPYWELGSPLQTILNWWAEGQGLQYLHAAAVGSADGAILLTGAGGSGKSSTALSCLRAGMGYLADDYCLAGQGRIWCLYGTAKLVGEMDLDRFPEWSAAVENRQREEGDKILLDVHAHRPQQVLNEAPLKAVVVPRIPPVQARESRLQELSGSAALLALAPTTLFQLAGTGQASLARMATILRQAPAYVLELGSDVEAVPRLLETLL